MAMNGTDILILVENPATPGDFIPVGCQRDATIEETVDPIDVSCKDNPERAVEYGRYSSTISTDALYVPDDAGQLALKAAMRDRTKVVIRVSELGTEVEEATAIVSGLNRNAPDQGEATYSISFDVDGGWTVAA